MARAFLLTLLSFALLAPALGWTGGGQAYWTACWDTLRYYWPLVLLFAWLWDRSFREWPRKGLFHWLSVLLHGAVLTLFALLALLLLHAVWFKDEQALLQHYATMAQNWGLIGGLMTLWYYALAKHPAINDNNPC